MKTAYAKSVAVVLLAFTLAGCAEQIAVVSEKPAARFQIAPGTNQVVAQTLGRAQGLERSQPLLALEAYTSAARDSLHEFERQPANHEARRAYNFAVARIFSIVRDAKLDPWTQPLVFGADRN